MKEPEISVGIITNAQEIHFTLNSQFLADGQPVQGEQHICLCEETILWNGKTWQELTFIPCNDNASFSLHDVVIGIDFHWERRETQTFLGTLHLIINEGKITVINRISAETYLTSVISSEMSSTSSLEFLKAHAVISRSWLLAQIEKRKKTNNNRPTVASGFTDENMCIRWYDHQDHALFHVCADDHCQRYQGITKISNPSVKKAVEDTCGQVLVYKDTICDARFSKCCGGISEEFNYCWEDRTYPYLTAIRDWKTPAASLPDLSREEEADRWIRQTPEAFCNTHDPQIRSQILNSYDQETTDFYRWKVHYSQEELAKLIQEKTQSDYGAILNLIPIERGKSGRISKLKIIGSKKSLIIGKELEIRKILSPTHLFSSAFVIDLKGEKNGIPQAFELTGAGWGHGVGLCQIGAAVMGEQGYAYNEILLHYYRNANIQKLY